MTGTTTTTDPPAVVARDLVFAWPTRPGVPGFRLTLPTWTVGRGGRVALHGPSGCGKSTLLNLVAGVEAPDAGSLVVDGHEHAGSTDASRRAWRIRRVGFVFQDFPLVEHLDALENVVLPYRLHDALRLDAPVRDRARALLAELGLADKTRRRPRELSQGERQRVAVARALVTEPALLLADEPTAGLDPERTAHVIDLLFRLVDDRGLTLLTVTHDPAVLARFADRLDLAAAGVTA